MRGWLPQTIPVTIIMNVNDNMWIISNYMWRKLIDILFKGAFKWWSHCIVLRFIQFHYSGHICVYFVRLYYLVIYVLSTMYCMNGIWVFLPEINFTYLFTNEIMVACMLLYTRDTYPKSDHIIILTYLYVFGYVLGVMYYVYVVNSA